MVPTERVVLQFFILILFTINGLHSFPRHHPSLGVLNELIGRDSNSPLIVVVDSNNQAKILDDERDPGQEQRKDRHVHNTDHHDPTFLEQEYENALYELLRTSERMLEKQQARSRSSKKGKNGKNGKNGKKGKNGKNGKNVKNKGKKKDSCENEESKQEFLAEQCSKSENSCDFDEGTC